MAAVLGNKNDIVRLLINKGADISIKAQNETAFSIADKVANSEAMEMILGSNHVKPFIAELIKLGRGGSNSMGFGYLGDKKLRTREIGDSLNNEGGKQLMLLGLSKVRNEYGNIAARELEMAWDGIGEWWG